MSEPPLFTFSGLAEDDLGSEGKSTEAAPPSHHLFEAMLPALYEKIPKLTELTEIDSRFNQYALIDGTLEGTHFPDGGLNLEITFLGLKGVLFFKRSWFNSMIRPLIDNDRLFTICQEVSALVYLHDKVQHQVFYHGTYGDNRSHAWLPLTPVVIWARDQLD